MTELQNVDVHAHIVPGPLIEMVGERQVEGLSLDDAFMVDGDRRLGPLRPGMTSASERLRWMDQEGIAEQWVSPWLDLFTWRQLGAEGRREWVSTVNRAVGDVVSASAGRLRAVPFVDVSLGAEIALEDLDRLAGEMDPFVVMVNSAPSGVALADPELAAFWDGVAAKKLTVMLHPPGNGPSCSFTRPVLQNVSGRVIDASAAVVELMAAGLFDRLTDLQVIVVHGGGFLPYQTFRLDGLVRAGLLDQTEMKRPPSEILSTLWYDTVALDPASLELLVRRVGAGRVLLGSDAPFPIGDQHPVRTLQSSALAESDKKAICCANARRLMQVRTSTAGGTRS